MKTSRCWRWWRQRGIVVGSTVRLISTSSLMLVCKKTAESRIFSQFRMLLQVNSYVFCQVSYLKFAVREFESTSNSAQIILALVRVEWEFKSLRTCLFLNSCFALCLLCSDDQTASPRQLIAPSMQVKLPQILERWCVVWEQPPCLACVLLSSGQQVSCTRPKHYSRTPITLSRIKRVTYILMSCSSSKRSVLPLSVAGKSRFYPRLIVRIMVSPTLAPLADHEAWTTQAIAKGCLNH